MGKIEQYKVRLELVKERKSEGKRVGLGTSLSIMIFRCFFGIYSLYQLIDVNNRGKLDIYEFYFQKVDFG